MTIESLNISERLASGDELEAAILVSELIEVGVDAMAIRAAVSTLAQGCGEGQTPWSYLAQLGFTGNQDDYGHLNNSRIQWVLENRRGIPISLAVILVQCARQLGWTSQGVNFPGHFLVKVDDQLVDPFSMAATSIAAMVKSQPTLRNAQNQFIAASVADIFLRMLNNAKYEFIRLRRWDRAIDMVDAQLQCRPQEFVYLVEKGDFWLAVGSARSARMSYVDAAAVAVSDQQQQLIGSRIESTPQSGHTIH